MLRWSDVLATKARNETLRREAAHEQWAQSVVAKPDRRARFYHSIAFQIGGWLTSTGQRIQQRYSTLVEPTFTSQIGSNKGAC